MIIVVPLNHGTQPRALLRDRLVSLPKQRRLDGPKFGAEPLARRLPPHVEALGLELSRTDVREPQEVKGLRLALAAAQPIPGGEPSELEQPRFLRVQGQAELGEPFPKFVQEPFGLMAVLEADDEVIGVTNDDDIAEGELW